MSMAAKTTTKLRREQKARRPRRVSRATKPTAHRKERDMNQHVRNVKTASATNPPQIAKSLARRDTGNKKSAVSAVEMSGYELVPRRKSRGEKATIEGCARLTWEPWTRSPGMRPGALIPSNESMFERAVTCRMAYAIMLRTRDELIEMHGGLGHDIVDRMMADILQAAEDLKSLVKMLDGSYARLLASAAAAIEQGVKFAGVDEKPKKRAKTKGAP